MIVLPSRMAPVPIIAMELASHPLAEVGTLLVERASTEELLRPFGTVGVDVVEV